MPSDTTNNGRAGRIILAAAAVSLPVYAILAFLGDLRGQLGALFGAQALLVPAMLAAWAALRRGGPREYRLALGAALLFRLAAAWGEPALSDDVYRFVWDGRVQLHGVHPYAHAPLDPALAGLRDEHWARINHPELKTIYPPASQMTFLALAALGAGPLGFKLALGLLDFGVVLALGSLLGHLALPRDRIVLYAWNPLAVLETAGSGHVESLGVLLVVLSAGWIIGRRPGLSTLGLALAIHVKLLPAVLLPGWARRLGVSRTALLAGALVALALPYALTGPAVGAGLFDYAQRWEHNDVAFSAVERTLTWLEPTPALKAAIGWLQQRLGREWTGWDFLYRHVWPGDLARLAMAAALVAWLVRLQLARVPDPARECFLALAAALLLSPTLHPWYVLWVLPFAAAYLSWGWLVFAMVVPLSYLGGAGSPVPAWVLAVEYVPLFGLLLWPALRRHRAAPRVC